MSSSKLTCKGAMRQVFMCLRTPTLRYRVLNSCRIWSPTGLNTPTSPSHTLSVYPVLLHREGGIELNQREG